MNEKNYQKLAELIEKAPRLLGPGGLFGGLNQEHGLMVDFIKFVRGLKIGNSMSPERVNIRNFVAYLGERKNAEDVARKLYDMRQNGEIVDDIHSREKNTLFNLAETLIDLGVGEKPENVGGDYEGVLRRAAEPQRAKRAEAPSEKGAKAKKDEIAAAPESAQAEEPLKTEGAAPAPGRDVASPETPLSTMGESLTDDISIAQGEEDQAGALAVDAETQAAQLNLQPATSDTENLPINEDQQRTSDILPQTVTEGDEGDLQPGAEEMSGTLGDSGLLRPLISPMIGEAVGGAGQAAGEAGQAAGQTADRPAGQATGEALAGTKAAPGAERRHIAQLPNGFRMLRKGPKKHGQGQEQGQGREQRQGRGAGESKQDQGRQTGPGRNPAQNFADSQAAQPQKSGVGGKVASGAGIAGSLALIKGMYGGAAANAASFGILQTILDLLT